MPIKSAKRAGEKMRDGWSSPCAHRALPTSHRAGRRSRSASRTDRIPYRSTAMDRPMDVRGPAQAHRRCRPAPARGRTLFAPAASGAFAGVMTGVLDLGFDSSTAGGGGAATTSGRKCSWWSDNDRLPIDRRAGRRRGGARSQSLVSPAALPWGRLERCLRFSSPSAPAGAVGFTPSIGFLFTSALAAPADAVFDSGGVTASAGLSVGAAGSGCFTGEGNARRPLAARSDHPVLLAAVGPEKAFAIGRASAESAQPAAARAGRRSRPARAGRYWGSADRSRRRARLMFAEERLILLGLPRLQRLIALCILRPRSLPIRLAHVVFRRSSPAAWAAAPPL